MVCARLLLYDFFYKKKKTIFGKDQSRGCQIPPITYKRIYGLEIAKLMCVALQKMRTAVGYYSLICFARILILYSLCNSTG